MTTKYDYKKYEGMNPWSYDLSDDPEFFGIHFIDGKMEIDIARYIESCKLAGIDDFLPEEFKKTSQKGSMPESLREPLYSYKCCPTRHGCSGATNCDNCYADYHR